MLSSKLIRGEGFRNPGNRYVDMGILCFFQDRVFAGKNIKGVQQRYD